MSKPSRSRRRSARRTGRAVELAAGRARRWRTGRSRSPGSRARAAARSMVCPTAPVAPTTATRSRGSSRPPVRTDARAGPRRGSAGTPSAAPGPPAAPRSERITHEILIGEVEIISMLMPSSASVSNTLRPRPDGCACRRRRSRPCRSRGRCRSRRCPARTEPASSARSAARRSSLDDRERHLGVAALLARLVLDDHVDVAVGVGERAEDRGRGARAVGNARAA